MPLLETDMNEVIVLKSKYNFSSRLSEALQALSNKFYKEARNSMNFRLFLLDAATKIYADSRKELLALSNKNSCRELLRYRILISSKFSAID